MRTSFICWQGVSQSKLNSSGLSADSMGFVQIQSSARASTSFPRAPVRLSTGNSSGDCWEQTSSRSGARRHGSVTGRGEPQQQPARPNAHPGTEAWPFIKHILGKVMKNKTLFKATSWRFCFQHFTDIQAQLKCYATYTYYVVYVLYLLQ